MAVNYNTSIVTDGLVAALDAANTKSYPGSGTAWTDLSGRSANGTLVNGPTYSSDKGGSIIFDGVNDYCDITSTSFGSATVLTIDCSIKWVAWTGGMFLGFTTYDVWTSSGTLGYNNGASNVVGISAATVTSLGLIGNWHHYTFIMNSSGSLSTNKIYIDGVDQGTLTAVVNADGAIPGLNNNLRLCAWNDGVFYGNMQYSNIKVYNRQLTSDEIKQNFNAVRGRFSL